MENNGCSWQQQLLPNLVHLTALTHTYICVQHSTDVQSQHYFTKPITLIIKIWQNITKMLRINVVIVMYANPPWPITQQHEHSHKCTGNQLEGTKHKCESPNLARRSQSPAVRTRPAWCSWRRSRCCPLSWPGFSHEETSHHLNCRCTRPLQEHRSTMLKLNTMHAIIHICNIEKNSWSS